MAQLVAHLHGMQGVRGSSPLISTNHHLVLCDQVIFLCLLYNSSKYPEDPF